ncbi:MAG: hypothetical protein U9R06_01825 [Patescibacteria group bacterium]|nr:hypothetical protein [Patescibacteria group bacterium]
MLPAIIPRCYKAECSGRLKNKMNKSKIMLTGAAALAALIAVSGIVFSASAQNQDNDSDFRGMGFVRGQNLTDEQRAEMQATMQAKIEEMGVDTSEMQARMEKRQFNSEERKARQAEMQANREAVQAAIEAGDYNAFASAIGENSPFAGKITPENFDRFIEAHESMEKGRSIMEELGIERGKWEFRVHGMMRK